MPGFSQLMEHEEHRWSYMTADQLLRRLRKITQPQKLQCFVIMAVRRGEFFLEREAYDRADVLGIDLRRALDAEWNSSYSERAVAERRRQAQGRIARGGLVGASRFLSEALSRPVSAAGSPSTTSPSIPTTSQRSTRGGRPTRFSAAEIVGPLSMPESKKKEPKKKVVRYIRFGKGGV